MSERLGEVVSLVAEKEQEEMMLHFVEGEVQETMKQLDENYGNEISKE